MTRPAVLCFLAVLCASPPAITRAELRVVAMEGYSVPGEEAGTVFGGVDFPIMNAAGDVAFTGRIGFGDGRSTDAVYRSLGTSDTRAIAHAGQGPDPATGVAFRWREVATWSTPRDSGFQGLDLNRSGSLVFNADLVGQRPRSIFDSVWLADRTGKNELVVKMTDQAPGSGAGHVFTTDPLYTFGPFYAFGGGRPFRLFGIDESDRVAFIAYLADSNDPYYDQGAAYVGTGMWGTDRIGTERYRNCQAPTSYPGPRCHQSGGLCKRRHRKMAELSLSSQLRRPIRG